MMIERDSADGVYQSPNGASPSESPYPPGRAWFVWSDEEGEDRQAILVACEERERLLSLLGHIQFNLRTRALTARIDDLTVPVVVVALRIMADDTTLLFSAWLNELSSRTPGILEAIANQAELRLVLVDVEGRTVATAEVKNVLTRRLQASRTWISKIASTAPWTSHHFAAAKAFIRSQHPTNQDLWNRFESDAQPEAAAEPPGEASGEIPNTAFTELAELTV